MTLSRRTVRTPHADIAVLESAGTGLPVLCLHGNSSCKEAFRHQLEGMPGQRFRMIAIDLPGHGESDNAAPAAIYTVPGYADAAFHVLDALGIRHAALFGWSLGGHVALEMLGRDDSFAGAMIVGAPPFSRGPLGIIRAFQANTGLLVCFKGPLSDRDVRRFADMCFGDDPDPLFLHMIARTDPRARTQLLKSMLMGEGGDQKWIAEHVAVPLAVINGAEEPFARLDYLESLAYGNLWGGRCHVMEGVGHAPFLQRPGDFNTILGRFLDDAARQAVSARRRALRSA